MTKRTDTNVAVLVQVMADVGFDHETIGKVTGVPLRTINDIANRRDLWAYTAEFNELRESYRFLLEKVHPRQRHGAQRYGYEAIRRVDCRGRMTAATIYSAIMRVTSRI